MQNFKDLHSHSAMHTKIAVINHLLHDIHGVSIQMHVLNEDMILSIMSVNIKYEIT